MKTYLVIVFNVRLIIVWFGCEDVYASQNITNNYSNDYSDASYPADNKSSKEYNSYEESEEQVPYYNKEIENNSYPTNDESDQIKKLDNNYVLAHNVKNYDKVKNHGNDDHNRKHWSHVGPRQKFGAGMSLNRNYWIYNCDDCWNTINSMLNDSQSRLAIANWNYEVNVSHETAKIFMEETIRHLNLTKYIMKDLLHTCRAENWRQRRMERIFVSTYGYGILDEISLKKLMECQSELLWMSARLRNCSSNSKLTHTHCDDVEFDFFESNEAADLLDQYVRWRTAANHKEPLKRFSTYVKEIRNMAKLNNESEPAQVFLKQYESETLWQDILDMVDKLKPLYNELHTFLRRRLRYLYTEEYIKREAMIPAYFIDTPWNENWIHLLPLFEKRKSFDHQNFTAILEKQKIDVKRMVEIAEESLMKIGFDKMPPKFWENSVFELPADKNYRNFVCNPEVWNMYNESDYRIKMCADRIKEDFLEIHRLLAGIEYVKQYQNQPFLFQRPPCEGFIEGIETAIELSASSSTYLETLFHLTDFNETFHLLEVGLRKIPFIFHGVAADQWRWEVLNEKLNQKQYNNQWWNLRNFYEGLEKPEYSPTAGLDVAMKYRDAIMEPYFGRVFGTILGFQMYRNICITLNEYNPSNRDKVPLHRCNIFTNKEIGATLKKGMALGASKPWQLVLEEMINDQDISSSGIVEYFDPLLKWLSSVNCKHEEYHSWKFYSSMPKASKQHHHSVRPHQKASSTTPRSEEDDDFIN